MPTDDPLHRGQPDARPLELVRGVEALEHAEERVTVPAVEAGAVVANVPVYRVES